jgi:N-terminal acetyltransferase B complex non-catalytic subunit
MSAAALALAERRCAPVYTALDSGNPAKALTLADQLLRSSPSPLAAALRLLALARLPDAARAHEAADALMASAPTDASSVHAAGLALSALGRRGDEATLFDAAATAHPGSLDAGRKALLALARASRWQRAQQVAMRLHKAAVAAAGAAPSGLRAQMRSEAGFFFWASIAAYLVLSRTPSAPGAALALPLAHRMATQHLETHPLGPRSDEEAWLATTVSARVAALKPAAELPGAMADALELLEQGEGPSLVRRNLGLEELRRELQVKAGQWQQMHSDASQALAAGNRNWPVVASLIDASVKLASESRDGALLSQAMDTLSALAPVASAKRDRTQRLGVLHLRAAVLKAELTALVGSDPAAYAAGLADELSSYLVDLGDKACAADDLAPYIPSLATKERVRFASWCEEPPQTFPDLRAMYAYLNRAKLSRLCGKYSAETLSDVALAARYTRAYAAALPLGADLPATEMQPADDFALLAAQTMLSQPLTAVALLGFALQKSPKGYRLRLLRSRLLARLGATSLSRDEAGRIGIKGVQWDTLGWIVSERRAHAAIGDEQRANKLAREAENLYKENEREVRAAL